MQAIRVDDGTVRLVADATPPEPTLGEARVAPTRLALDIDDALAVEGGFSGVIGHEFVGRVESVSLDPNHPMQSLVGRRVVGTAHLPCGVCDRCRAGLRLHCASATVLGLDRRDGCFAQVFTIPATNLAPVPEDLDDERAVFAGSLGRVLHAARMLKLEGKRYVSVLGDGPLALLAAQVMARRNDTVRLLGSHDANLELCTKWGVKHRPEDEVGRRQDQEIVFDCAGTPESLALSLGLVRPRGMVVLMRARPGAALDPASVIASEVQVFGSRGCALGEAVHELAHDRVDVLSLVARRLRFEDAPAALGAVAKPGTLKILLDAA